MEPTAAPGDRAASARAALDRELRSLGERHTDRHLPRELLPDLVRTLQNRGYTMHWDSPDIVADAEVSEEVARIFPSLEGILMISQGCARYIAEAGPPKLRTRAVPRLLSGEAIGCVASTEAEHGSNNAAVETRAVLKGEEYIVNGQKRWISNGAVSDYAVVLCRVVGGAHGPDQIRPIIVERERSPYQTTDLPKLGLKAFVTSEITFADCRVPRENCAEDPTLRHLQLVFTGLQWSRCRMAVIAVGIARAAFEACVDHARVRRQFGRPIGEFQLIQDKIATMATEIDAARLLVHRALAALRAGHRSDREASMAKAYATEMAVRVTSEAIQIHGANGLSPHYSIERHFRDARTLTIAEGTTEIHKLVVARSILGLSAF